MLNLDHVIIRAGDVPATLAEITESAGLPILTEPTEIGGITSAIASAGGIDIEVLSIGETPPLRPQGYGLGFTAQVPLEEAIDMLRRSGIPASAPVRARARANGTVRSWRATQLHRLLPDPFPIRTSLRPYGIPDRAAQTIGSALGKIPSVARGATRNAGESMVVLTEYDFDVDTVRATLAHGPKLMEVHVNAPGCSTAWSRMPVDDSLLHLSDATPAGVVRLTFSAPTGRTPAPFACGDVHFEFR